MKQSTRYRTFFLLNLFGIVVVVALLVTIALQLHSRASLSEGREGGGEGRSCSSPRSIFMSVAMLVDEWEERVDRLGLFLWRVEWGEEFLRAEHRWNDDH